MSRNIQHGIIKSSDPTVNDDVDAQIKVLTPWLNTSTGQILRCVDNPSGAALWQFTTVRRIFEKDDTTDTTTSISKQEKLTVNVPVGFVPPGYDAKVKIEVSAEIRNDDAGAGVGVRVRGDGVTLSLVAPVIDAANGGEWGMYSMMDEITVDDTTFDVDVYFDSGEIGKQARIRRTRVYITIMELVIPAP